MALRASATAASTGRPAASAPYKRGSEFDGGVVADCELHRDDGGDAPAHQGVRHPGERVGRVSAARLAGVEYRQPQAGVITQHDTEIAAGDRQAAPCPSVNSRTPPRSASNSPWPM